MPSPAPEGDGDGDGDEGASEIPHVLYYKKHSKLERPTRGKLLLGSQEISFRSKEKDYRWDLATIDVEKFKGRASHGMKIVGRRRGGEGDQQEYIFTMVKDQSYERIRSAVEAAKESTEKKHRHHRHRRKAHDRDKTERENELQPVGEDEPLKQESSRGSIEAAEPGEGKDTGPLFEEDVLTIKNVLYYKDHRHKSATPTKGTLRLGSSTIAFRSQMHDYRWNLHSIAVEKFQGRMNHGFKILGTREMTEDEAALAGWVEEERTDAKNQEREGEYIFTHVGVTKVYIIQGAVKKAKEEKEKEEKEEEEEGRLMCCCCRAWARMQASIRAMEEREAKQSRRRVHTFESFQEPLVHRPDSHH